MYSSLQSFDKVLQGKGRKTFIMTDHRGRAAVEAELELSLLLVLARVMLATWISRDDQQAPRIFYVAAEIPPPAFQQAVVSAGGQVVVAGEGPFSPERDIVPFSGQVLEPLDLVNAANAGLALRRLREACLSQTAADVRKYAQQLATRVGVIEALDEENEIVYWSAVLEISAMLGELRRDLGQGTWQRPPAEEKLPFAFGIMRNGAFEWANLWAKAAAFLRTGDSEGLFS